MQVLRTFFAISPHSGASSLLGSQTPFERAARSGAFLQQLSNIPSERSRSQMARMILWYHYAMSGLQSLKKDRCLPQDPRESRLRVGPTQSTCLLVGALIVGASGAMGDDISNQSQLDGDQRGLQQNQHHRGQFGVVG